MRGVKGGPSNRAITAALRRADDYCGHCGRALRHCEPTAVGYVRDNRRLVCVGECCAGRLVETVGVGIYVSAQRETAWQIADREWFAEHRDRTHRLRPSFSGEGAPWI